jgi:nitrite reductase/ring-hydroxylating ferredoxin subunit
MTPPPSPTRRAVLSSAGVAGIAVCLGGCAAASSGSSGNSGSTSGGGGTTAKASDVPVGAGLIVGQYVVTQPKAGTYEAFSYLCTHQNLPVQQVTDAAIVCGRHGSTFSLADGSVITGPATKALTKATVTVSGDTLTIS